MTTIEEAREAAMRQLSRAIPTKKGDNDRSYYLCEKAVDAYAAARALAAHVDVCEHPPIRPTCGLEDAYCEKAKELGK